MIKSPTIHKVTETGHGECFNVDLTKVFTLIYPGEELQHSKLLVNSIIGLKRMNQDTCNKTINDDLEVSPKDTCSSSQYIGYFTLIGGFALNAE